MLIALAVTGMVYALATEPRAARDSADTAR
jgi:hypothetical protein